MLNTEAGVWGYPPNCFSRRRRAKIFGFSETLLKTYRNLYSQVCDWDNLFLAWRKARRGKRNRPPAAGFEFNLEQNLADLQVELINKNYQPGSYYSFYIHEPKRRLISAAPFRDRVVHHALCNIIEPIFEQTFIYDSYANRKDKGTHRALDRAQEYAQNYRYVLQCDVKQFFPSVDHIVLHDTLAGKITDVALLDLIDSILESGNGIQSDDYEPEWFPGDDLFAVNRPKGLPIGNLTSQFWANCYMNQFDNYVKRDLKCPAYLRYVDDFLLFANDKEPLHQWLAQVKEKLAELRLVLHSGAHPQPVGEGIPFLGFIVFPTHRRVKRRKVVHFQRQLRQALAEYRHTDLERSHIHSTIKGWINHVRYADTWGLRKSVLKPVRL